MDFSRRAAGRDQLIGHQQLGDAAARRGTEVHRLGELLVDGQDVAKPEELAGHIDAYRAPRPCCRDFNARDQPQLGAKVRDLYAAGAAEPDRVVKIVDDAYVGELADAVTGSLGGKVGVAPRVFLKELVTDDLERVEQFADFDPRRHYALTLAASELSEVERNAAALAVPSAARADSG